MINNSTNIRILNKLKIFNEVRYINYKIANCNAERLKFYTQFIKPGDVCFDIGANIGQKADVFLKLKARVIAVEPQSECIAFLQKKYKNNKAITLVHKAVDSRVGETEIFLCEANALSSLSPEWIKKAKGLFNDFAWDKTEKVQTTTLDALITEFGLPKFCKVDVEGLELNVLKGLSQPVPYLVFEFTRENFDLNLQALDHLRGLGRFEANFSWPEKIGFRLAGWEESGRFVQSLKQLPEKERYGDIYVHFL